MKHFYSFMLMFIALMASHISAAEATQLSVNGMTFSYSLTDNTATLTAVDETQISDVLEIPDAINVDDDTKNRYTVTAIAYNVLSNNNSTIKTVILPKSLKTIGNSFMSGSTGVEYLRIPASVTTIGTYVFHQSSIKELYIEDSENNLIFQVAYNDMNGLHGLAFGGCKIETLYYGRVCNGGLLYPFSSKGIKTLTIGPLVKELPESAFSSNNLETVTIPPNVKKIGEGAFSNNKLQSVVTNTGLEEVSKYAFRYCRSLKSISLPSSVIRIGEAAFQSCDSMETVVLQNGLKNIKASAFDCCYALRNINIPQSVDSIGDYAFRCCRSLESITLPNTPIILGIGVFNQCLALQTVDFGGAPYIPGNACQSCSALTSVTFGNTNLQRINGYAFSGCTSLTSITIPNSVTTIGEYAFNNCSNLPSIEIPDAVTSIGANCFYGCSKLESVKLSQNVEEIPMSAFYQCKLLDNIEIPSSVKKIGANAFNECNLSNFKFGNNVEFIGQRAFYNCKMSRLELPASIDSIEGSAFISCSQLTYVKLPSQLRTISNFTFQNCKKLQTIDFPEALEKIGAYSFYDCDSLKSANFPSTLKEIGTQAFYSCGKLKIVKFPASLTKLSTSSFESCNIEEFDCPSLTWYFDYFVPQGVGNNGFHLLINGEEITSVKFPDGITEIADYKFEKAAYIESFDIPNSVQKIGSNAFYGCKELTNITLPTNLKEIKSYAFYNCSALESIILPDSLEEIGGYSFYGCSKINHIKIPQKITKLGDQTFRDCTTLTSIDFGSNIESLGRCCFYNCSSLDSINLPQNLKKIESSAFQQCTKLNSIEFPLSLERIGSESFKGCKKITNIFCPWIEPIFSDKFLSDEFENNVYNNASLHIPAGTLSKYKEKNYWKNFKNIVEDYGIDYATQALVTIPQVDETKGSITVSKGPETFTNSFIANKGDEITITITPNEGSSIKSITINGVKYDTPQITLVVNENLDIAVEFATSYLITIESPDEATGSIRVLNGSAEVTSGSMIAEGVQLTIEATPASGYEFGSILINGQAISGNSFTVSQNSVVSAIFNKIPTYTVTIIEPATEAGSIEVTLDGKPIESGTEVISGSIITVTASVNENYILLAIKCNGSKISGNSITVTSNVEISADILPINSGIEITDFPEYTAPQGRVHSGMTTYLDQIYTSGGLTDVIQTWDNCPSTLHSVMPKAVVASKGSTITINLQGHAIGEPSGATVYQDLRYCVAHIFTDWDGSKEFNGESAQYGVYHPSGTITYSNSSIKPAATGEKHIYGNYDEVMNIAHTVTVPDNAIGHARIRVIYQGAWQGQITSPYATNVSDGVTYDIPLYVVEPASIDEILADEFRSDLPILLYNFQGIQVNAENLRPGIYIARQGSKVKKILIK